MVSRRAWVRRTRRVLGRALVWGASVGLAAASGCSDGPSGPGSLDAVVESARRLAGAVVIEVRGVGIRGFASQGTNQVFWDAQEEPGTFRVVIVNPGDAAPLAFTIQVDDLSAAVPVGTVMEATALTNEPLGDVSDFALRVVE